MVTNVWGSRSGKFLKHDEASFFINFFRLAASEADRINEAEESEDDSLDDVDAATAMLELKHGQVPNGNQDIYTRDYIQQKYLRKKPKLREVCEGYFSYNAR